MSSTADTRVMLITGTSRGIGKYLAEYYVDRGYQVVGCSRQDLDVESLKYQYFSLDVCDEDAVKRLLFGIRGSYGRLDVLINNAGVASMNHVLLTPFRKAQEIMATNLLGTFIFCREAAKLMKRNQFGRIVNFSSVAAPLKLEGEAIYAASKAAVVSLTQILAKELAQYGITVNAVGPNPIKTDLIRSVPQMKINELISKQAIKQFGEFQDITNVIDFFIQPGSRLITGQIIYLGGV